MVNLSLEFLIKVFLIVYVLHDQYIIFSLCTWVVDWFVTKNILFDFWETKVVSFQGDHYTTTTATKLTFSSQQTLFIVELSQGKMLLFCGGCQQNVRKSINKFLLVLASVLLVATTGGCSTTAFLDFKHHNYDEMHTYLQQIHSECPQLTRIYDIGQVGLHNMYYFNSKFSTH